MKHAPVKDCSGCTACQAICPKTAIAMVADREGFIYPKVDESKCVRCGLCEKVCPSVNRNPRRTPIAVYAAQAKDDEVRIKSSSGGIFPMLARQIIGRGGVVYGAGFDYDDWHVMHKAVEDDGGIEDVRGSKYVQSDVQGTFVTVRDNLAKGREVLFSGTPCQVAGLKAYLCLQRIQTSRLHLVEVICHAVPSPLVWRRYLKSRLANAEIPVKKICFRHKNCGWKKYSLALFFANGKECLRGMDSDPFLRGFMGELYNRPSCHNCQCRELRSGADLTIGDYWRVHEKFPEMDDDRGTSLVLVNTDEGAALIKGIWGQMSVVESDFADAIRVNPAIVCSAAPHRNRARFFSELDRGSFDELVARLLKRPLWRRIASRIKRMVVGK